MERRPPIGFIQFDERKNSHSYGNVIFDEKKNALTVVKFVRSNFSYDG
jgi:hypothetical protein